MQQGRQQRLQQLGCQRHAGLDDHHHFQRADNTVDDRHGVYDNHRDRHDPGNAARGHQRHHARHVHGFGAGLRYQHHHDHDDDLVDAPLTMSHARDPDHPSPPDVSPPRELGSQPKPDRQRVDHPTPTPRAPVDPRPHPGRRVFAR